MYTLTSFLLMVLFSSVFLGCAHHKDVRPGGADGENLIVIKSKTQQDGIRDALSQATHYCKQFGKQPRITKEGKKYQGDMDEAVYNQSKKIKDAASVFLGSIPEGQQIGMAADKYLGDPYATELKFVCE